MTQGEIVNILTTILCPVDHLCLIIPVIQGLLSMQHDNIHIGLIQNQSGCHITAVLRCNLTSCHSNRNIIFFIEVGGPLVLAEALQVRRDILRANIHEKVRIIMIALQVQEVDVGMTCNLVKNTSSGCFSIVWFIKEISCDENSAYSPRLCRFHHSLEGL